ncbi:MAG TPA: 3-hydroxyacyl-ACP dehydratase [Chryseosolibacter sp.]
MVNDFSVKETEINALLVLNESHEIFKGHFPGQPVVPGVCMMQSVKELVERHVEQKLTLVEADNMKFLSVIDPRENKEIEAKISFVKNGSQLSVNASLFAGTVTFFKLKATLNLSI